MLFTDPIFLFYFLPTALLLHRITVGFGKAGTYNDLSRLCIFLLTLVFYGWNEPRWLVPFFICVAFDFLWASLMARSEDLRLRKIFLFLSIFQNLTLLGIYKYWSLILNTIEGISPALAGQIPHFHFNETLPPGISFYTFESLSFVIDVYHRKVTPPKRPLEFFAFLGMFPRFVAGPIVRYREMKSQFSNYQGAQWESGLFLFCVGFFLKACFADHFAVFTRYAFGGSGNVSCLSAWVGTFAYTMQLYFDFSGYSLMAIGLGRCLGFQFPTNFNRPYLADGLQDFWRRWHISLSSWLRDYLYVPLGGNRKGSVRTYVNIFLTMVIGGLWHGSALKFAGWGAWHGLFLCLERRFPVSKKTPLFLRRTTTFLVVMVGWVFFRADATRVALRIIVAMFNPFDQRLAFNPEGLVAKPLSLGFCILGVFYCFFIESRINLLNIERSAVLSWTQRGAALAMLACGLLLVASSDTIPFLYFQF